jgi:hypothetical protein
MPLQDNSYDCGVFVCLNAAYMLYSKLSPSDRQILITCECSWCILWTRRAKTSDFEDGLSIQQHGTDGHTWLQSTTGGPAAHPGPLSTAAESGSRDTNRNPVMTSGGERELFIGTQYSNLYTAVDTPAEAAWFNVDNNDSTWRHDETPSTPCL